MAVGLSALLDLPFSFTGHAKDIFVDANALQDKIRLASFVVTCSEYNADYLRRHCPELDPDRVVVIHCGIPVSRIRWSPPGPSDTPLILSVGRLVEKKGHRYLVQACEYMKRRGLRFRCLIIGDGPLRESLSEEIGRRDLEDCVALKGSLPYPEVRSYFRKSSAFVLPSVITPDGDREGLPVALMEALAFGVPAISTPTAGIPELVVNERTGLLVPPGNAQLLARAMERLIRDPELGRRLSVEGRETVRTGFEIEDTALQLAGLFRQSVGAISGVPANRETFLRAVI
jgi:glycosyltransferase involved in cell wall biosynthesis